MTDKVSQLAGKMAFGLALVPVFVLIGLVLSADIDDDSPP
jgi:F0F1-type ATP synthase membrane subunit c/vacuolar-type H+-ATPase subunit K